MPVATTGNNNLRHILRAMADIGSPRHDAHHGVADAATASDAGATDTAALWSRIRDDLRSRGLRWTPQRRLILDVLEATNGHITGSELVERCRERDPDTTPSTVYRTLDVLEELGYIRHSHSAAGREEFHVLPGRRPRPPAVPRVPPDLGARGGRHQRAGPADRAPVRVHRGRRPPDDHRPVRRLRGCRGRRRRAHGPAGHDH